MWLLICGIVYLALHLVPVFISEPQIWGIDSWSYLPVYAAFLLFVAGAASFIPALQKSIFTAWEKISGNILKIPVFIWVLITGALFYIFGQTTFFLGDGYLRARNLEQGIFLSPAEPLDTLAHYWVYVLLKPVFNVTAQEIYKWISILAGTGLLAGLAYYFKKLYPDKPGSRWLFASAVLSAGFIQLFFGYVESYTLTVTFGILFFVSAMVMAKQSKYSIIPSVFYSLAVCSHPMVLIFLPSFAYIYSKVISKESGNTGKWLFSFGLLPFFFFIVLGIFYLNGITPAGYFSLLTTGERFLPLTNEAGGYGILSLNHLFDFFNQILLVTPFIVAIPLLFRKENNIKGNPNILFLGLSLITGLVYAFTINPVLGYSRDWDMFSVSVFPLTLAIVYILIEKHTVNLNRIAFPLVVISLLHTIPWILLNHSESASVKRAEHMAKTSYWNGHAKAALYDELKSFYYAAGDDKKSTEYATQAYREKPSERYLLSLARQKINTGAEAEALALLEQLSATNYNRKEVTFLLGTLYYNKKDFHKAEMFLRETAAIDRTNYEAFYLLGQVYMLSGRAGQAADHFKAAIRINPNRLEAYTSLGGIYYDMGNNEDAMAVFRKAYMLAPGDAGTNYNLALCYAVEGNKQSALKHLKKAEESGFDKNAAAALRTELTRK